MQFEPDEILAIARDHFEHQRLEEALARAKALLQLPQPPAGARELAARIYARLRLHQRAIALLQECLEMNPDSLELRIELAMASQDGGNFDHALELWDDMLLRHPLLPPALFHAAVLRAQRKQFADALRHIEVLLQTAEKDNLYVGKARELQEALNRMASEPEQLAE
jgi:tetratricopeptide (TPR) repeat protein